MPLDGPERRRREAPIVVEPPPKFRIDLPRKIPDGLPRTPMQFPSSNLITDFLLRLLRDGWNETTEDSFPSVCLPGPKREPQKIKLLVQVSLPSVGILAIDHLRLLRMQFQPTLLQPCRYFDTHQVRFPLRPAMDDDIVRIPLERQMMPVSAHPDIERVVQKQIGQQGADHSSLRSAFLPLQQISLFILRRRFQPPLDVPYNPPLLRVFPDGLHHQTVIEIVEEALDVQVANPVVGPAHLPRLPHRIQRRLVRAIPVRCRQE